MSEPKATPRPWAVHERFLTVIVPLEHKHRPIGASIDEDTDRDTYATAIADAVSDPLSGFAHDRDKEEVRANAQLIVTAVNAHDDLLAACKAALAYFDECVMSCEPDEDDVAVAEVTILRAAIKKAEGETK